MVAPRARQAVCRRPPIGNQPAYQGHDYFFCEKGCKLEFDDEPDRYLDLAYVPSM